MTESKYIPKIYINQELYPNIREFKNINPNNVNIIDIFGDGNYLYRAISQFLYGSHQSHQNIRNQIYKKALSKKNIPNVYIETENGKYMKNI